MTTKLKIENDASSNGDAIVRWANICYVEGKLGDHTNRLTLFPGESMTLGITDFSLVSIHEEWPTTKPTELGNAPVPEGSEH